jgi:hypothetical protein
VGHQALIDTTTPAGTVTSAQSMPAVKTSICDGGEVSAGSVGLRPAGSSRRCSQLAGCQTMNTQSIFADASFSFSRFGASQKLWPEPS